MTERKQLMEDWRAGGCRDRTGPCYTDGTSRSTEHKRVQRFPAGDYPTRLGVR